MNQIEGRVLRNKTTTFFYRFALEDVICEGRCVGKIVDYVEELYTNEGKELFAQLGMKLSLTHYNQRVNRKI